MSYQAPTYRHVNEPVKFLGFEALDLVIFLFFFGPVQAIASVTGLLPGGWGNILSVALAFGIPASLRVIRWGKPRKYLRYWIHRSRLSRLLPAALRVGGTAPAPGLLRSDLSYLVAARHNRALFGLERE